MACFCGRVEIAILLLDSGADIEVKDSRGNTPLLNLFSPLISDVIQSRLSETMVLKYGANPLVADRFGKSALDYDYRVVTGCSGNKVPHRQVLIQLREEYTNKHALEKSEHTVPLSSGWEMEM